MSEKKRNRVLFVGMDAADPLYIDQRIADGGLKNIAELRRSGAWGPMRSTFPVLSSAAWSTISTGLNPEKHGIYEFFKRKTDTWQDYPVNGSNKKGEDLWQIASRHGLRTVSINMPITYPPKPVSDGIVISGMDTPGEGTAFVSPESEKEPLFEAVPDYRIELTAAQFETADDFLEATSKTMHARCDAALYLFKKHDPDLAIVIFTAMDRVLHALWKYVDPSHEASKRPEAKEWRDKIDKLYDQLDDHLGTLREWAGEDSHTFVASDHGSAAVHGVFFLNRWLIREGYLSVTNGGINQALKVGDLLQNWVKKNFPRWLKNILNKLFPGAYASVGTKLGLSMLNSSATRAYAWRKTDVLRLNLEGREPDGTIKTGKEADQLMKEIASKLETIVDPRTGHKPIKRVLSRYDVYPGADPLEDCPDLMIEWDTKLYEVDTTFDNPNGDLFASEEKPDKPWREEINGNHAINGVFGAVGPMINEGVSLPGLEIDTVAPSILQILGITKPDGMCGKVSSLLIQDDTVNGEKLESTEPAPDSAPSGSGEYTDEEKELIEKRLRDLGYM